MRFRKKPVIIEAHQWLKNGDHPKDDVFRAYEDTGAEPSEAREGLVVRYFRNPGVPGSKTCRDCGCTMRDHGWIDSVNTLNPSGCTVCPGDWVIPEMSDATKFYPCKPDIFSATYEPVP